MMRRIMAVVGSGDGRRRRFWLDQPPVMGRWGSDRGITSVTGVVTDRSLDGGHGGVEADEVMV